MLGNAKKLARFTGLATLFAMVLTSHSDAQSLRERKLEENAPDVLQGRQLTQLPGTEDLDPSQADATPLGKNLAGIAVFDNPDKIKSSSTVKGIDSANVTARAGVDLEKVLKPFLGKPISFRLIVEIRTAVIKAYRDAGFAFLAVFTPPQEVTSGSLQILVNLYALGDTRVEGAKWGDEEHILKNIRVPKGVVIDNKKLLSDLNWLNLNPYRNLVVVAEPGKKFSETNLVFRADEKKPWSAFAGVSNHGSESTDTRRVFAGINVANIPAIDHQLSYKLTMSPQAFQRLNQQRVSTVDQAAYLSHDGIYFVPLPWRHKLKTRVAHITNRSNAATVLVSESVDVIRSAEYMVPLPILGSFQSEFYSKAELKSSKRDTYSSAVLVATVEQDIAQGTLGYRGRGTNPLGSISFDAKAVYSPGDLTDNNSDAALAAYSGNTLAKAEYAFYYATLQQRINLPKDLYLQTNFVGQYSPDVLPSSEGFSVGGNDTVRGYTNAEAVSGDSGLNIRAELHAPLHNYMGDKKPEEINYLDAYVFADWGEVYANSTSESSSLSSVGVGANVGLFGGLAIEGNLGFVLTPNGTNSQRGDFQAYVSATVKY